VLDELETWSYELSLEPGENQVDLTSRKENGKESQDHTRATIVFEPDFPAQPVLNPVVSPTNVATQTISGTKPGNASLILDELDEQGGVLDSNEIAGPGEAEWSHALTLGSQDTIRYYSLAAVDSSGRASEPVDFQIELDMTAPAVVSHYPADGEVNLPTNTLIYLVLDGPLSLASDSINPAIIAVTDSFGNPVASSLLYNPLSHSLFVASMLLADILCPGGRGEPAGHPGQEPDRPPGTLGAPHHNPGPGSPGPADGRSSATGHGQRIVAGAGGRQAGRHLGSIQRPGHNPAQPGYHLVVQRRPGSRAQRDRAQVQRRRRYPQRSGTPAGGLYPAV
jgi:hypothetical protein